MAADVASETSVSQSMIAAAFNILSAEKSSILVFKVAAITFAAI